MRQWRRISRIFEPQAVVEARHSPSVERLIAGVRAAAERIIRESHYVAIDDAIDVVVHDTEPRMPELIEVEAAIETSREARRAVGFVGEEPVQPAMRSVSWRAG